MTDVNISEDLASAWADSCLHVNHLNTLVQREIQAGNLERARELSERARQRAWDLFNALVERGARKPEGFCEPGKDPNQPPEDTR